MIRCPAAQSDHRPTRGFSLLEVIVAIVLLGTGLLGFVAAVSTAVRAVGESSVRLRAVELAVAHRDADLSRGCGGLTTTGSYGDLDLTTTSVALPGTAQRVAVTAERPTPRGKKTDTLVGICVP